MRTHAHTCTHTHTHTHTHRGFPGGIKGKEPACQCRKWKRWRFDPGFPGGVDSKKSACNAEDPGLISGSGRFPRGGNGHPLQYARLENSTDRGTWQAAVHGVEMTKQLTHTHPWAGKIPWRRAGQPGPVSLPQSIGPSSPLSRTSPSPLFLKPVPLASRAPSFIPSTVLPPSPVHLLCLSCYFHSEWGFQSL